jgi:hypothetical protein
MLQQTNLMEMESPTNRPDHGKSSDRLNFVILLVLGTELVATNRWFTVLDDECAIIDRAAQPLSETMSLFLRGVGQHEHPPLYDFILHFWIRLTSGEMHLLRVPAIIFYALGVWVLASAARELGGRTSQTCVLILAALWPYGFHFGRVATWYSFSFLVVSLLTLSYLRYVEQSSAKNWAWVVGCSLALIYTSYFGWALLACLALDYVIRNYRKGDIRWWPLAGAGAILVAAYLPVYGPFLTEVRNGVHESSSAGVLLFSGIYHLYCLFVSESVAPWFWPLGVPAGMAIVVCLLVTFGSIPPATRRFLFYFTGLFLAMGILSIGNPKRHMLIAAWLVLPVGAALGHVASPAKRRALMASLVVIGAIGWFGIFSRQLYAAPRWVEPWEEVAQQAAEVASKDGIVIGNNPSFFFYLTYLVPPKKPKHVRNLSGLLPESTRRARVYDPKQWIDADHPVRSTILFVKGLQYGIPAGPTIETENWLDSHCNAVSTRQFAHDIGASWKQRFAPTTGQLEWRITEKLYGCR